MVMTEKDLFPILPYPSNQCSVLQTDRPSFPAQGYLIADTQCREDEERLLQLENALGNKLLVHECWRNILPRAQILIPAAISGGTLRDRYASAAEENRERCWLQIIPLRMRFSLPCRTGTGQQLMPLELMKCIEGKAQFYSPDLCCRYCYGSGSEIFLFDTEESLAEKIRLAKSEGFAGAVFPAGENILTEKYSLTTHPMTDKL